MMGARGSNSKAADREKRFPLGASVTLVQLSENPYAVYARLREHEPVTWAARLKMWLVTRYDLVQQVLLDTDHFVVGTGHSTIFRTFGENMLTCEGERHRRYRNRAIQRAFSPRMSRESAAGEIDRLVALLIDSFADRGHADLRAVFASRLPVLTMLSIFGLPQTDEPKLRLWYDAFEAALANFSGDEKIAARAKQYVGEFHDYIQPAISALRRDDDGSLLGLMVNQDAHDRLSDVEIRRNALIIFFGGISTVEALVLNCLHALFTHPDCLSRFRSDREYVAKIIDETMRWLGPVQSATRHVVAPVCFAGVELSEGETVNCMLGAANHDPAIFDQPQFFDPDRENVKRHLGFAYGVHSCLGMHLAKLEVTLALTGLFDRLPELRVAPGRNIQIQGYEFRQPRNFPVIW